MAKGYWGSRSKVYTVAKGTVEKGLQYAYRDRKTKKRHFRGLWIQRINAGVRQEGLSYSQFMGKVHSKNVQLNRKVLADLAMNHPEAFKKSSSCYTIATAYLIRKGTLTGSFFLPFQK